LESSQVGRYAERLTHYTDDVAQRHNFQGINRSGTRVDDRPPAPPRHPDPG
jgi:hypothetical protein